MNRTEVIATGPCTVKFFAGDVVYLATTIGAITLTQNTADDVPVPPGIRRKNGSKSHLTANALQNLFTPLDTA